MMTARPLNSGRTARGTAVRSERGNGAIGGGRAVGRPYKESESFKCSSVCMASRKSRYPAPCPGSESRASEIYKSSLGHL